LILTFLIAIKPLYDLKKNKISSIASTSNSQPVSSQNSKAKVTDVLDQFILFGCLIFPFSTLFGNEI
jgi:hypothetical protein